MLYALRFIGSCFFPSKSMGLYVWHCSIPAAVKKHEPMNRKAYNKVHERYYADPVGFITGSMPNVTVTIKDEHGNATKNPKNVPYNPLER